MKEQQLTEQTQLAMRKKKLAFWSSLEFAHNTF